MMVRQALHESVSTRRSHVYPQVTSRRIAWGALAKRLVAQDEILFADAFGQMRVSTALLQNDSKQLEPLNDRKGTK